MFKEDIQRMLDAVDYSTLDDNSRGFIDKMRRNLAKYGDKTFITEYQVKWLQDLVPDWEKGSDGETNT